MHYMSYAADAYILEGIKQLGETIHRDMMERGFDVANRPETEDIALMHSELSEALEGIRHGNPPDQHCPEFTSAEIEYADAAIRIMHTCAARGHRLGPAILAKCVFNRSRPHKHGKTC